MASVQETWNPAGKEGYSWESNDVYGGESRVVTESQPQNLDVCFFIVKCQKIS